MTGKAPNPDEWMPRGSCRQRDPDTFYPDSTAPIAAAEAVHVCRGGGGDTRCPVINDCLTYALATREEHGVWGGTTPRERHAILKRLDRQDRKAPA